MVPHKPAGLTGRNIALCRKHRQEIPGQTTHFFPKTFPVTFAKLNFCHPAKPGHAEREIYAGRDKFTIPQPLRPHCSNTQSILMKYLGILLMAVITTFATAQEHKLELLWQTDSVVAVPEGVLHDPKSRTLYVSLINGAPWEADGRGGVGKLSMDGKKYDSLWVTGLSAPKGMAIYGNRLYVADISDLVIIDIKNGKVEKKLAIDSAKALNDVTVTDKGIVYVSDSRTGRVWRVENDAAALFLDSLRGVNGLKAIGDDLIIAAGKSFIKANSNKAITKIAELPQGGDGVEPIGNGDFIVTSWAGYIFYVHADGRVDTILETHAEKKNTADIGYDPAKRIVYVPTFFAKTVAAYQLK
jgi:sugar lactone lactonase YvrE